MQATRSPILFISLIATILGRKKNRHLLGRVAGHDLAVLVIGRLPAHLGDEHADVVAREPVHLGHLIGVGRRVVRRDHPLAQHAAVAKGIDVA